MYAWGLGKSCRNFNVKLVDRSYRSNKMNELKIYPKRSFNNYVDKKREVGGRGVSGKSRVGHVTKG